MSVARHPRRFGPLVGSGKGLACRLPSQSCDGANCRDYRIDKSSNHRRPPTILPREMPPDPLSRWTCFRSDFLCSIKLSNLIFVTLREPIEYCSAPASMRASSCLSTNARRLCADAMRQSLHGLRLLGRCLYYSISTLLQIIYALAPKYARNRSIGNSEPWPWCNRPSSSSCRSVGAIRIGCRVLLHLRGG